MAQKRLGVVVSAPDSSAVLTSIANLEQRGIPAAWLTSAGAGGADLLGVFAGAALGRRGIRAGRPSRRPSHATPSRVARRRRGLADRGRGATVGRPCAGVRP